MNSEWGGGLWKEQKVLKAVQMFTRELAISVLLPEWFQASYLNQTLHVWSLIKCSSYSGYLTWDPRYRPENLGSYRRSSGELQCRKYYRKEKFKIFGVPDCTVPIAMDASASLFFLCFPACETGESSSFLYAGKQQRWICICAMSRGPWHTKALLLWAEPWVPKGLITPGPNCFGGSEHSFLCLAEPRTNSPPGKWECAVSCTCMRRGKMAPFTVILPFSHFRVLGTLSCLYLSE